MLRSCGERERFGLGVWAALVTTACVDTAQPNYRDLATAMALVRSGQEIDDQGVTGPIDFDGSGDCVASGVEFWRVDGGMFRVVL